MKNKKGFTLVELMAVIVILAIIIAIAVPAYGAIKTNIDKNNYENKIELIETAAAKYAEDTRYETMFVEDLIKAGYLDPDDKDGIIKNNLTSEYINCNVVRVKQENGMYYAEFLKDEHHGTYNKDTKEASCYRNKINEFNKNLSIVMYEYENGTTKEINYSEETKWWTRKDVLLEVKVADGKEIESIEWYKGYTQQVIPYEEGTPIEQKQTTLVQTTSVLQENYTVVAKLSDGKEYRATTRVYIDKIAPKFYQNDGKELDDKWLQAITYNVKAYDNESGIYGYCISINGIECNKKDDYKKKLDKIEENGTYEVYIMDNVGNISKNVQSISMIDKTAPKSSTILKKNHSPNSVDLILTAQDMESGIDHFIVYYGTSSSTMIPTDPIDSNNEPPTEEVTKETTITGLTAGKTYFFKSVAYDKAGNPLESDTISVQLCTWNTYYYYTTSKSTGTTSTLKSMSNISVGKTSVSTGTTVGKTKTSLYRTKFKTTAYWTYASSTGTFTWYADGRKFGGENKRYTSNSKSWWTSTMSGCYSSYGQGYTKAFSTASTSVSLVNGAAQTATYWIRTFSNGTYSTSWYDVHPIANGNLAYQYIRKGAYSITATRNKSCGTSFSTTSTITNTTTLYTQSIIYSASPIYEHFPLYSTYTSYDKNTSIARNPSYYTNIPRCEN